MNKKLFTYLEQYQSENTTSTIYGVFDGVKYPMLWSDLEDGVLTYDMLFKEEELREEMQEVAPFLIALDFQSETGIEQSKELMKCYGENGCIFLTTSLGFEEILDKMREMFYVYNSNHEVGYFRFYWATVFTEFVKQKEGNALFNLFYEIDKYWCEDSLDKETLMQFSIKEKRLIEENIRIECEN